MIVENHHMHKLNDFQQEIKIDRLVSPTDRPNPKSRPHTRVRGSVHEFQSEQSQLDPGYSQRVMTTRPKGRIKKGVCYVSKEPVPKHAKNPFVTEFETSTNQSHQPEHFSNSQMSFLYKRSTPNVQSKRNRLYLAAASSSGVSQSKKNQLS